MPYVKQTIRDELVSGRSAQDAGEMNYMITKVLLREDICPSVKRVLIGIIVGDYIQHVKSTGPMRYQHINDVMGALYGAQYEYISRLRPEQDNSAHDTIMGVIESTTDAAQDFYDTIAVPYENEKVEENGDVYPVAKENE